LPRHFKRHRIRGITYNLTPAGLDAAAGMERHRMAKYRDRLPQLEGSVFLTDGGLETTLIFHYGLELPEFAAFTLLKAPEGRARLHEYYSTYAALAHNNGVGLILDSATWRANPDWGAKLGYSKESLAEANRDAIELLLEVRREYESETTLLPISGCIGPRGDGYDPGTLMTEDEAEEYHGEQINVFSATEADLVTAMTMTNVAEATGIVKAAKAAGMPVVISFTVETDGALPEGSSLREAIEGVDASTGSWPAYYMVNCAHPTHFSGALAEGEPWTKRIRGIRANASEMSHAELDGAERLDEGDPEKLGRQYRVLMGRLPRLNVLGGCCGTDHRHIGEIFKACALK